jgi:hypothetical protein
LTVRAAIRRRRDWTDDANIVTATDLPNYSEDAAAKVGDP